MMMLNTIAPEAGSKKSKSRKGRGIGSGLGKTCGRGHKGQLSRSGRTRRLGFEGGQMPLARRMPKSGFRSRKSLFRAEVSLSELAAVSANDVTLKVLKDEGIVNSNIKYVKVFASGKINTPKNLQGIPVSCGARVAIEAAGGSIVE